MDLFFPIDSFLTDFSGRHSALYSVVPIKNRSTVIIIKVRDLMEIADRAERHDIIDVFKISNPPHLSNPLPYRHIILRQ